LLNRKLLKAEIAKNGMTQASVAERIGMSYPTFYRKMKNGTFGIDEANRIIVLLGIEDAGLIFFADE